MADLGHELTDKRLKALEKKIAKEYRKATKDASQKLVDYLEKTERGRIFQEQLLKEGKITKKEYSDWCYRHSMVGKRWEQMRDVLAEDFHNANKIALKMTKGEMPNVYALNGNFATYQIEHDGLIDTGLTLYNHDTAEYLLGDQRQLMPRPSTRKAREIAANKDMQWNRDHIQSAVLQGVLQGESPYDVAKRLQEVGQMNNNASVRYARTMTTSAQNAGRYEAFHRAKRAGVDLVIEWQATLDDRTRHEHRMMHGQRREVDEPFETPDGYTIYYPADCSGSSDAPQKEIWNCFVGETEIAPDSEIIRSYKHEYNGELIRIETASGLNFTCTPNHPILTPLGWVAAAKLNEGDDLLVTGVVDNGILLRDANINKVHTSFKTLHDSLVGFWHDERISMTDFNFHGDIPTADVEVVSKKRELSFDRNSSDLQKEGKVGLKKTDSLVLGLRHLVSCLKRVYVSSLRFVCGRSEPFALFRRSLRHSDIHGLGTIPWWDVSVSEYPIDNLPTTTIIRSELLNGITGKVFLDNIVCVNKSSGRTHVYNLQTENGYYFVGNSITQNGEKYSGNFAIAKNCRCTLLSWVKGFEGDTVKESPKMGDMSFEEWQREKAPNPGKKDEQPTGFTSNQSPVIVKPNIGFTDRVKVVQDRVAANGVITEADLHEAGKELARDFDALMKSGIVMTGEDHADWLADKLSQVRQVGSQGIDLNIHLMKSRSPAKKDIIFAYSHYPRDWVEKSVSFGRINPILDINGRGCYRHISSAASELLIDGDRTIAAFHELGHRFQRVVPGIKEAEKRFFDQRTIGEVPRWLGPPYKKSEVAKYDKFVDPYIGKINTSGAYEIATMGFQYAYTDPTILAADPEMQSLIYGMLLLL